MYARMYTHTADGGPNVCPDGIYPTSVKMTCYILYRMNIYACTTNTQAPPPPPPMRL